MPILIICILVGVYLLAYYFTKYLSSTTSLFTLLDCPNERSLHTTPTSRTGGLAVLVSWGVGLACLYYIGKMMDSDMPWILGLTMMLAVVSIWDDKRGLSPALRFVFHLMVAVVLVGAAGLKFENIALPVENVIYLKSFAFLITVLFILWMVNLYNFMDGMDGFAGGMAFIGFGFLSYIAWTQGNESLLYPMLALIAAVGGFLIHNFPPAKIFLGDVGSICMGFLTAAFCVKGVRDGLFDVWAFILIFSPFIVDATVTLLRRLFSGQKIWKAHREHCYQRLVLSGWGHRRVVLVEYILMLASGGSAVIYLHCHKPFQLALLLVWCLIYTALICGVCIFENNYKNKCFRKL